ncbi:MAG: multiheme c-type cytochrome [bacterium]
MKKHIVLQVFSLIVKASFVLLCSIPAYAEPHTYVGVDSCKMCHENQYKVWASSAHAKAYNSLNETGKKNIKCLSCHTTNGTAKFPDVQCEACHGPGSDYSDMDTMKNFKKVWDAGLNRHASATCLNCHNEKCQRFQGFDFKVYWMEIMH